MLGVRVGITEQYTLKPKPYYTPRNMFYGSGIMGKKMETTDYFYYYHEPCPKYGPRNRVITRGGKASTILSDLQPPTKHMIGLQVNYYEDPLARSIRASLAKSMASSITT